MEVLLHRGDCLTSYESGRGEMQITLKIRITVSIPTNNDATHPCGWENGNDLSSIYRTCMYQKLMTNVRKIVKRVEVRKFQ